MWQKIRKFLGTNSIYPDIKRVYYVIIAEEKFSRREIFAKYLGAVSRSCSTK